ncbi:hypothetical protein N2152v2_006406 [Parachlorella kessleri]
MAQRMPASARCLALLAVLCTLCTAEDTAGNSTGWRVLWADEFNNGLNRNKWRFELGAGCQYLSDDSEMCGWGNGEQQFYTANTTNARVNNGVLVIEARKEASGRLTSARLKTQGLYAIQPSSQRKTIKVEARIFLPQGQGLWPAFWMLPAGNEYQLGAGTYGRWALSGEIDIMESANDMAELHGTVHFGGMWPQNAYLTKVIPTPSGSTPFAKNWHVYGIEWENEEIRWYVDGQQYASQVSGKDRGGWFSMAANAGATAPFDKPFYLVLNLALGGSFPGNTPIDTLDATLAQPKRMLVDYVRVSGKA